jgi:hypothetical protein
MERDHVLLSYKGDISSDLLSSVYQIIETRLETIDADPKARKKVYNIMVESLQNIFHHMERLREENANDQESKSAMFMIVHDEQRNYYIHTGNFILNSKCEMLEERLQKVNAMFPEELRAHYIEKLGTTELSEKGGAGLGIIDIARKSGNKLEYKFNRISDKYSFFSLTVCINH